MARGIVKGRFPEAAREAEENADRAAKTSVMVNIVERDDGVRVGKEHQGGCRSIQEKLLRLPGSSIRSAIASCTDPITLPPEYQTENLASGNYC